MNLIVEKFNLLKVLSDFGIERSRVSRYLCNGVYELLQNEQEGDEPVFPSEVPLIYLVIHYRSTLSADPVHSEVVQLFVDRA